MQFDSLRTKSLNVVKTGHQTAKVARLRTWLKSTIETPKIGSLLTKTLLKWVIESAKVCSFSDNKFGSSKLPVT